VTPAVAILVGPVLLTGCSAAPGPPPAAAAPASAAPRADPMPGGPLSSTAGQSPADVALQLEALLGQHSVLVNAAREDARAADDYRTAYSHAFGIGQTPAATLLPPEQSAPLSQPSWRLAERDRLLGEHIALAVAALRAGATESPDFPAAAANLDKNTDELTAAMGTLFGPAAGQQFMTLWADHHDQMLTQQVNAMANKDYAKAHELAYGAYQDMFGLAKQLSVAFGDTVAARLPRGGAETGAGGTAPR